MLYTACGTDRNLKVNFNHGVDGTQRSVWQLLLENHHQNPETGHLDDSLLKKIKAAAKRKAPVAEGMEKVIIVTSSQRMVGLAH